MANYRSVHVKFWSDPDIESLAPNTRYLFLYLVTNEHRNEACLYSISLAKIAFETGLRSSDVEKALAELQAKRKVFHDAASATIWVVNAVKYQALNPNCIKGITHDMERCSSPKLLKSFCDYYRGFGDLGLVCEGFLNRYETVWKGFANPPLGTGTDTGTGDEGVGEGDEGGAAGDGATGGATPPPTKPSRPSRRDEFESDTAALVIPEALRTPAFVEWWEKWLECRYRHEKPKSGWERLFSNQLANLSEFSVEDAIAALKHSVTNDYTGLFPKASARPGGGGAGGASGGFVTYPARMLAATAAASLARERGQSQSYATTWPRYRGPDGKLFFRHPDDHSRVIPEGFALWAHDRPPAERSTAERSTAERSTAERSTAERSTSERPTSAVEVPS